MPSPSGPFQPMPTSNSIVGVVCGHGVSGPAPITEPS
jgi:hypothetical protein